MHYGQKIKNDNNMKKIINYYVVGLVFWGSALINADGIPLVPAVKTAVVAALIGGCYGGGAGLGISAVTGHTPESGLVQGATVGACCCFWSTCAIIRWLYSGKRTA